MKSFKDSEGRNWFVKLDLSTLERVEAATGVCLDDIASGTPKSIMQLQSPKTLADVLWCLVEPQAVEKKLSRGEFLASIGRDEIGDARKALHDEQVFFSPQEVREIMEMCIAEAEANKAMLIEQAKSEVRKAMSEAFATSLPESSVSTLEAGASVS
jgi:hypothetical protein